MKAGRNFAIVAANLWHDFKKAFHHMKTFPIIVTGICFSFLISCYAAPVIIGAQAKQRETSLTLPERCRLYVYGFATGGLESSLFTEGQTIALNALDTGYPGVAIAASKSNRNSFTTRCANYVIGGFGVSGFNYVQGFYATNPGPSARSVALQFTLTAPAMVAIMGNGGDQTSIAFTGCDPLILDASVINELAYASLAIAHAYLGPGTYTIRATTISASGSDADREEDLIGVFVFSDAPGVAKSDSPVFPLSLSPPPPPPPTVVTSKPPLTTPSTGEENKPIGRYVILGVGVLVFIALAVAIIRMIIPRRNG
jgi:hypothetical protein